ncbi:MAG TPA: extracellular solute-binding protein [Planctomycetota bacterium]|nr:extracellular solute-binding protein [Planctomycetota bacterium]
MMLRWLALIAPLALLAIPLALREPATDRPSNDARPLIIITPNNEAIRAEFTRAFRTFAKRELGHDVAIDWRTPGGMADISKLINEQYAAVAAEHLAGFDAKTFNDAKAGDAPARKAFLASDLGIGIDLVFGGGEFDHRSLAGKGYLVDAELLKALPEIFRDEVIPQTLAGETVYDPQGRYYGTALSSFGICFNPDRVQALRSPHLAEFRDPNQPGEVFKTWSDLAHPALFGHVVMVDPTKSGSVATCYVIMIQKQLAAAVKKAGATPATATPQQLDSGWLNGLTLIKAIAGNARSVTDSASKVPRDVGRGDAIAGMCIDFYGRSEAEWTAQESKHERVFFVTPQGGTSISADPIALLRGAPHREEALAFMRFVLSVEGQRLWNYRVGEPGGPVHYALRRWSVRRDLFTPEHLAHSSDPGEDPFVLARSFQLQPAWTGPYFELIRATIKAVVLDPRDELQDAWAAIIATNKPDSAAWQAFRWLPWDYRDAAAAKKRLEADRITTVREWTITAQQRYRAAARLAREGK